MENQISIVNTESEISLETSKEDMAAMLVKSILGTALFGSSIAEVITAIIPHQKLERLIDFVQVLNFKIRNIERKIGEQELKTEDFTDLFEDGMVQASRALTEGQLEYIASLLKNSLTDEDLEHIEKKKLLSLLGKLNDAEIIWLKSYSFQDFGSQDYTEFQETHKEILEVVHIAYGGGPDSIPHKAFDKKALQESYILTLLNLRLIKRKDSTTLNQVALHEVEASHFNCSELGYLLLRFIDMETVEDFEA